MSSQSGTQDKLTAQLDVQKARFASDYPQLLAAVDGYKQANDGVIHAGEKIAQVLKSMGEMYPVNSYGIAFNKLSQGQTQLGAHRHNFMTKVINDKFLSPLSKQLKADRDAFAAQDKDIRNQIAQYGNDIKKMMSQAQKEQKKGTDAMLTALSLVNTKVQEFDTKNQQLLESIEKKEQARFVEWFQRWSQVMDAQLQFHTESAKKLNELEQVWQEAIGGKASGSTPQPDTSNADSKSGADEEAEEAADTGEKKKQVKKKASKKKAAKD